MAPLLAFPPTAMQAADLPVKAVKKATVRAEFLKRHRADDEDTKRKAFNRAIEEAADRNLIGLREIGGMQLSWLV